ILISSDYISVDSHQYYFYFVFSFFFFFSSRRRHTRSKRDWSSDVCSSDLSRSPKSVFRGALSLGPKNRFGGTRALPARWGARVRSEERRVGKECRSRGSPQQ